MLLIQPTVAHTTAIVLSLQAVGLVEVIGMDTGALAWVQHPFGKVASNPHSQSLIEAVHGATRVA